MIPTSVPRQKALLAGAALAVVVLCAAATRLNATGAARLVLGVTSIAGLGFWLSKNRFTRRPAFQLEPRLSVVSRAGLSPRAGVALIEVDGAAFLVVHGDGYAQVHPTPRATRAAGPVLLNDVP